MASTGTIPAIAGGATKTRISISWVDSDNKEYSDNFLSNAAPSAVNLQAYVDAAQAASNASSFKLEVTTVYQGVKQPANADDASRESVLDKIRTSYSKVADDAYQQVYVPAPLGALILPDGTVDKSNALYTEWKASVDALIQTGFTVLNAEFVQYSGRNDKVVPA